MSSNSSFHLGLPPSGPTENGGGEVTGGGPTNPCEVGLTSGVLREVNPML